MHADASQIGASFLAKRSRLNAREMLITLIESNPDDSKDDLFSKFLNEIKGEKEYQRAIDWYFFVNMHEYYVSNRNNRSPANREKRREEGRSMVESIKDQILLLNLEMPNGKRMHNCTGAEMERFGGAYQRIGREVGKTKLVGEVLNEKEVRAILR